MPGKETQIQGLIRDDYPLPLLQELIAELVYETKEHNKGAMSRRYEQILKALFGEPEKNESPKRDGTFMEDLREVARLSQQTEEYEDYTKTIGRAAANVARERKISGYKRGDPVPKDIDDNILVAAESYTKALIRDLEDTSIIERIKLGQYRPEDSSEQEGTNLVEMDFIQSLCPRWLDKYGEHWTKR